MSFSEFLRDSVLKAIIKSEELSLLEYINANCTYLVRIGDYGAIFRIVDNELFVYVFDISSRGDTCKKPRKL